MNLRRCLLFCVGTIWAPILFGAISVADVIIYGSQEKEHWSANAQFVLKLREKGEEELTLWQKTEDGLKKIWGRAYVNDYPLPYVTGDGRYVVLRDHRGSLGDKVIVILGPKGQINGCYTLGEILPEWEIFSAGSSVTKIWWDNHAWFSLINDKQFALITQMGTVRCFDLPAGKIFNPSEEKITEIAELVHAEADVWLESKNASDRIRGITLVGALKIKDAVPHATRLFNDKTMTGSVSGRGRPSAKIYGVQKAAALALVRLIGAEAIPIIEGELPTANWDMKRSLISSLGQLDQQGYTIIDSPHSEAALEMWQRLATHTSDDIRFPALNAVLSREGEIFLSEHPELVECENASVRGTVIGILSKMDSPRSLALLKKAITDKDQINRLWALRHYVARNPSELEDTLVPFLDDEFSTIRLEATEQLVRLGNETGLVKLRETVQSWALPAKSKGTVQEAESICKLIAELKLADVKENVEKARSHGPENARFQTYLVGALAALGDERALQDLQQSVQTGVNLHRASAVDMLGYMVDIESTRLLKRAAIGDKREIQRRAVEALTKRAQRAERKVVELEQLLSSDTASPPASEN